MFSNLQTKVSHSVTVSVHCVEVLPWFGTTGFLLTSVSSAARDLLTTFVGDDVVAKCTNNLKKTKLH